METDFKKVQKDTELELFGTLLSEMSLSNLRIMSCKLGDEIAEAQVQITHLNVCDRQGKRLSMEAYQEWLMGRKTELLHMKRKMRWLRHAITEKEEAR
jgi:hypothetical protein